MNRSGLAQFLIETDNNFRKYNEETNALTNEMMKQLYPMFWSFKTEYTRYGERPEEPSKVAMETQSGEDLDHPLVN